MEEKQVHHDDKATKREKKEKKKRKDLELNNGEPDNNNHNGKEKKEKKKKKKNEGKPTVSIAVAGSIIDNAQSLELATLLAGQIARAVTIFRIDEVVVFDSKAMSNEDTETLIQEYNDESEDENGAKFLVRILRYLETPQYLRRRLFPMHKTLKFVGLLPPLDAPHHYRKHEWSQFREGVTLEGDRSKGTLVDVGLTKNILVEEILEPGKRVTVLMGTNRDLNPDVLKKVVSSSTPREELDLYWGYKVRYASNLSSVFNNCSYKGGYDHIIGTSEHGQVIRSSELKLPSFKHLLIVLGGVAGLEESIEEDNNLKGKCANDVFISYLNICPNQGSRTIRTEEALLICLEYFQEPIRRAGLQL